MKIWFFKIGLVFCLFFFLLYALVFCFRVLSLLYEDLCSIFPHLLLTNENFYLKYGQNRCDLTVIDFFKIYLDELYFFCYTDFTWLKLYILFLFSSYFIFLYIYFKFFEKKESKKMLTEEVTVLEIKKIKVLNSLLRLNLIRYHLLLHFYFENTIKKHVFVHKTFMETKKNLLINILELHAILENKEFSEYLIVVVEGHIREIEYFQMKAEDDFFKNFVYSIEKEYCNEILEVLEKDENDIKLILNGVDFFLEKLLTISKF